MPHMAVDGASIWYTDHGGPGRPVVFVHAAGGNSAGWEQQLSPFAEAGVRCITYDLRGLGRSTVEPGKEQAAASTDDLVALVQHLGLARFSLIGQALGGYTALECAVDHPELIEALVISNSFGGISDPVYDAARARLSPPTQRTVEQRELGAGYRAANPDGVRRFLEIEHLNPERPPGAPRQQTRAPMTAERLKTLRVPALVLGGDQDVMTPPDLMRVMVAYMPTASFEVIPGVGHSGYWEKPDAWNRLVIDFLKTHP